MQWKARKAEKAKYARNLSSGTSCCRWTPATPAQPAKAQHEDLLVFSDRSACRAVEPPFARTQTPERIIHIIPINVKLSGSACTPDDGNGGGIETRNFDLAGVYVRAMVHDLQMFNKIKKLSPSFDAFVARKSNSK